MHCTRETIEEIAQFVREELELSVPISLDMAIQKLGGQCIPTSTSEYRAKIEKSSDLQYIFVLKYAEGKNKEQTRFFVAYELGHLLLHIIGTNKSSSPEADWEANEFAASLLMPKDEFIDYCMENTSDKGKIDLNCVAQHFQVSKQAAYVRGRVLNLWEHSII